MKDLDSSLLDRITDGFVALNQDWQFVFVNSQAAAILGRDRHELLRMNIWDEFPILVGEPSYAACHQAMTQQAPAQLERYSAELDKWIENRIYPAPDGLTIFFTNITERKTAEVRLRQYQDIFNLAEIGLVIGTGDGTTLETMNPAFARMHGYEVTELMGRAVLDLYAPEEQHRVPNLIRRTDEIGHHVYESLHLHRDGTTFPVSVDTTAVRDAAGHILYRIVNVTDISERNQAEKALTAAALRLETLLANIQAGVIVEDSQGQIVLVNRAFCEMMGFETSPAALIGANVPRLARQTSLTFPDPEAFMARARLLRQRQEAVESEELRLTDGRVWERDYVPVFPGGEGDGYGGHLWLFRDVTERRRIEQQVQDDALVLASQRAELEKTNASLTAANAQLGEANARLEALATTDDLTGLLNHRVFAERIREEWLRARRYKEPLSLVLLDVDHFKAYNDSFGHLAGNEVLRSLADILHENARETDLVARFGGEEFVVVLPHTVAAEAMNIAERIRAGVETHAWNLRLLTVSLGVCELAQAMDDAAALIHCADLAMYKSKTDGRNRVTQGQA